MLAKLTTDVLQNRKQKNTLNIKMTCCLWLVQFSANILTLLLVKLFFGKNKFFHHLFAILTSSVNFNLLPFLYVIMTDEPVKTALAEKQYLELFQLLFLHQFSNWDKKIKKSLNSENLWALGLFLVFVCFFVVLPTFQKVPFQERNQ